ncbi:BnaA02g14560D [Brassica napus]|uniref:(rape) hypothetical protein n=1 Tax=Brassica napus TaxID=3708 RepID=A0A078IMP8_BRANA|nr:unnamed protein product [Brassica napus]CDY50298.1 BnaA02g14560D [Brassica napus]
MGKRKAPKKSSPPKFPLGAHTQVSTENGTPMAVDFTIASHVTEEASASQITASASKLQDPTSDLTSGSEKPITVVSVNSAKVATVTDPGTTPLCDEKEEGEISPINSNLESQNTTTSTKPDLWTGLFKGNMKKLQRKGDSFMLPSGDFIIGQFYSDPPSQGTIQKIVNGIWSKQFRDITVSKMEGFAFLFRIPNASTRAHVLKQCLWQIEGQTMFVAKWEPGIVGDPKFLHPHTANKTNLEIRRIRVSSPWMPPVCSFCKEAGHSLKRCKKAPITCKACKSTSHQQSDCTRSKGKSPAKSVNNQRPVHNSKEVRTNTKGANDLQPPTSSLKSSKASFNSMEKGEASLPVGTRSLGSADPPDPVNSETSPAESDSSDLDSTDSQFSDDSGFQDVISSRQKKKDRGRGPKNK